MVRAHSMLCKKATAKERHLERTSLAVLTLQELDSIRSGCNASISFHWNPSKCSQARHPEGTMGTQEVACELKTK